MTGEYMAPYVGPADAAKSENQKIKNIMNVVGDYVKAWHDSSSLNWLSKHFYHFNGGV